MVSTLAGIRAIAFDFDGVVVDSMPVHEACWREALEAVLGSEAGRFHDAIRRNLFRGRAGPAMFEATGIPEAARGALRSRKDALWRTRAAAVALMPGAAEALMEFGARFPLAVATTARRAFVDGILSRESLAPLFGVIVTDADVAQPKPAPDILETIARSLGIPASEIAMVGDTASDRRMAEATGAPFLWFGTGALARPGVEQLGDRHPVASDWPALAKLFDGGRP